MHNAQKKQIHTQGKTSVAKDKVSGECNILQLRRWRVMEVVSHAGQRSRHICGHDVTNDMGRASSGIKAFDLDAMTATTHSGTIYKLLGAPGNARSGERAWSNWCRINSVAGAVDVTSEYFDLGSLIPGPEREGQ
jgi:hypothetical protein